MRHLSVAKLPRGVCARRAMAAADAAAHAHALRSLREPDQGGEFAKKLRLISWIPASVLFRLLMLWRYDGLVFLHDEEDRAIGHVFFQEHAESWHVFGVWLEKELRGTDMSVRMLREFIVHAWNSGIRSIRLGTDRNAVMSRLRERTFEAGLNLPCRLIPGENGWAMLAA